MLNLPVYARNGMCYFHTRIDNHQIKRSLNTRDPQLAMIMPAGMRLTTVASLSRIALSNIVEIINNHPPRHTLNVLLTNVLDAFIPELSGPNRKTLLFVMHQFLIQRTTFSDYSMRVHDVLREALIYYTRHSRPSKVATK